MLTIVRIALNKPYTFVVMAMLIVIFGVTAALRTPIDIFPNIGIPVVAVVWTYDGLPADDMSKRVIYYYERTLSTQVNDIEHIESQSLPRYGVVKVFFQRGVNINAALAQTTAASQTVLKYLPQGITPPFVLSFNASSVPVIQLALSSEGLSQAQLFDAGQNFIRPQLAQVAGSAIPSPYGGKILQVQVDIDQDKLQAYGLSAQDVVDAIGRQNIVTPVGTEKVGDFEFVVQLNGSPTRIDEINDMPIRVVNGATVFVRDVAYAHFGAPPQINMVRVDDAERRLDDDPEDGVGVYARRHQRRQGAASQTARDAAFQPEAGHNQRPVVVRICGRQFGDLRRGRSGGADRLDDPDLSWQLALDPHHHDLNSAGDPGVRVGAVGNRRDHQRHDARRTGAGGRHSRR